ncbi:hypothetical protein [Gilliamella sp. Imp1-1]|uniref:hypothetical protein n=1 Tax=Gilliamella sp. Imp1-1 TaxID=3120248 RepID=UPI000461CF28|nr:hypothetical protein [Gilliamella apicola]KDN09344.1 hypothetical protein GAPWKB30_2050 [Gilliamella apicola]OCG53410.1 hypothetical protein A9G38_03890 [Gilliamella apicola]
MGIWEGDWCKGSVGATPSSSGNHYQRRIGVGFFTEWGMIDTFFIPDAGFVGSAYLTSIPCLDEKWFLSSTHGGWRPWHVWQGRRTP